MTLINCLIHQTCKKIMVDDAKILLTVYYRGRLIGRNMSRRPRIRKKLRRSLTKCSSVEYISRQTNVCYKKVIIGENCFSHIKDDLEGNLAKIAEGKPFSYELIN